MGYNWFGSSTQTSKQCLRVIIGQEHLQSTLHLVKNRLFAVFGQVKKASNFQFQGFWYKERWMWSIIDINPRTNPSRPNLGYNISIFRLNLQFFTLCERPSVAERPQRPKKRPNHEFMISLRVCSDASVTNGGQQVRIWYIDGFWCITLYYRGPEGPPGSQNRCTSPG